MFMHIRVLLLLLFVVSPTYSAAAGVMSAKEYLALEPSSCVSGLRIPELYRAAVLVNRAYEDDIAIGQEICVDGLGAETAPVEHMLKDGFGFRLTVDDTIIVAIRGTKKWAAEGSIEIASDRIAVTESGVRGGRHIGFQSFFRSIEGDILGIWSDLHRSARGKLLILGHSLGGALTEQAYAKCCLLANKVGSRMRVDAIGFQTPSVFDDEFAANFMASTIDPRTGTSKFGTCSLINHPDDRIIGGYAYWTDEPGFDTRVQWKPAPLGPVYHLAGTGSPSVKAHSLEETMIPAIVALDP